VPTASTSSPLVQSTTVVHTTPSQVIIDISTSILIQDYYKYYYNQPIESFTPAYYALPDGSLVAPPLMHDLNDVHILLIWTGALCAFFIMNIITVIRYIHRAKVKDKTLFYILLASQIAGPIAFIPFIVSIFDQSSNCYMCVSVVSVLLLYS
jgi:hypothetical protein